MKSASRPQAAICHTIWMAALCMFLICTCRPAFAVTRVLGDNETVVSSDTIERNYNYYDKETDTYVPFSDRLVYEETSDGEGYCVLYILKGTEFYSDGYEWDPGCSVVTVKTSTGSTYTIPGRPLSPLYIKETSSDGTVSVRALQSDNNICVIEEGVTSLPADTFYQYKKECRIWRWYMPDSLTYIDPGWQTTLNGSQMTFYCSSTSYAASFAKENGINIVYTDSKSITDLPASSIHVSSSAVYTGSAVKPKVTIDGLTEGTDYSLSYFDNTGVGTGKVMIYGKGVYEGVIAKTFTIRLGTPALVSASNSLTGAKITWKAVKCVNSYTNKYRVMRRATGSSTWSKVKDVAVDSSASTQSCVDTTAVSGKTYYYTVKVINTSGSAVSKYNTTGLKRLYLAPVKGSDMTYSNLSSGLKISWKKVTGAKGYYVYRKSSSASSYTKVGTVTSGSTVTWKDTKASNGTTYIYRVRAYSGTVLGSYSGKTAVRLTTPSISSLTNVSSRKMTVKWGSNSKATGYQVRYSTSSSMPSGSCKTVTVTSASKTIASLTKGKTYYVKVRSYKTVSGTKYYSGWSTKKSVKISK